MAPLYPLTFHPLFQERVWGGRKLAELYQKPLPPDQLIGESWEITDRPGAVSVIANGPWTGRDLRWLMENHPRDLLGTSKPTPARFPLLVKILDARDKLSLQVHPPTAVAARLGGEPKTELWYVADAAPTAELYAGLKRGVTPVDFEQKIAGGAVAECFHRLPVKTGDALFLPSGRVHALGAGNVIFEIQQNSDTTYRVFDWNRMGLDGQPRALHLPESLASIDFNDFEPALIQAQYSRNPVHKVRFLVDCPLFGVDACQAKRGLRFYLRLNGPVILGLLRGRLRITHEAQVVNLAAGQFCLLPACLERVALTAETQVEYLQAQF